MDLSNFVDMKGFEDKYMIDCSGRIFSKVRNKLCTVHRVPNSTGYHLFFNKRIHRLVAENFLPNWDSKLEVNHLDGNKTNNHVSNLEMVTRHENIQHAYKVGLIVKGEKHKSAKLTDKEVTQIRDLCKNTKFTQKTIALWYGVTESNISQIKRNISRLA